LKKEQREEIAMKNKLPAKVAMLLKSIVLTLTAALALAGSVPAQTISWYDKGTYLGGSEAEWYQPKVAGDGDGNVVVVGLDNTTSLGPLMYWSGYNPYNETSLNGLAYGTEYAVGVSPAATLMWLSINPGPGYGEVLEVHQGGQRNGAALWSHLAPYLDNSEVGDALNFTDGQEYDTGYNPSVASDGPFSNVSYSDQWANVVEVHQAAAGASALWYHVGQVTLTNNSTVSYTWGPSYEFDAGSLPSVALCYDWPMMSEVAIEVHQGGNGTLWYSTGVLSGNQIAWNPSTQYDNGYAPSITCDYSLEADGPDQAVIEVHQASNPAAGESTALWYHVATAFSPSTVSWGPSQRYDTGCNPTITLGNGSSAPALDLVEVHLKTCGEPGPLLYDYGSIAWE
jgi:hypothetical protein